MSTLIDQSSIEGMRVEYYQTSEGKYMGVIYPNEQSHQSIGVTECVPSFTHCCNLAFDKIVSLRHIKSHKLIDFSFCGMRTDIYHNEITDNYFGVMYPNEFSLVAEGLTPPYKTVNECCKYALDTIKNVVQFRSNF